LDAGGKCIHGRLLENGCGVGRYIQHLAPYCRSIVGLEYDFVRLQEAHHYTNLVIQGVGETLPFPDSCFEAILSHEVLEHVQGDQAAVTEMVRVLRPQGRLLLFVPNRGYPFETHGIYWRGQYHFGNIPLVSYLPISLRNRLAPHVRIYTASSLGKLFRNLPVKIIQRQIIFGAYDNIIARSPALGSSLRSVLQTLEKTPLRIFGLSHFWVLEKI
jgi:SAM-dependent methyltransferase